MTDLRRVKNKVSHSCTPQLHGKIHWIFFDLFLPDSENQRPSGRLV